MDILTKQWNLFWLTISYRVPPTFATRRYKSITKWMRNKLHVNNHYEGMKIKCRHYNDKMPNTFWLQYSEHSIFINLLNIKGVGNESFFPYYNTLENLLYRIRDELVQLIKSCVMRMLSSHFSNSWEKNMKLKSWNWNEYEPWDMTRNSRSWSTNVMIIHTSFSRYNEGI